MPKVSREKNKITAVPKQEYVAACSNCGVLLTEKTLKKLNDKNYCESCLAKTNLTPVEKPTFFFMPQGLLKFIAYLVCFFKPSVGFILGIIYFSQKDENTKKFGRNCFIFMALGMIIYGVLILFGWSFYMANGDLSDINIGEGYY